MMRCSLLLTAASLLSAAKENYVNVCMEGKYHKPEPGPEDYLHDKCSPWKLKSCCTENTTHAAHQDAPDLYNFNWDHCGVMSEQCRNHFIQDTCFYECSPNLGPWIMKVNQTWRKERIMDIPLCKEDCETWYNDCKHDYTCMENWHTGWNWTTGINKCPAGRRCQKLSVVFPSPKDFCEKVWSNSYKFTENTRGSERCMQLWFENNDVSPNVKAAQYYANVKNSARHPHLELLLFLAPVYTLWAV
ncbi:folate receptor beta-like [Rhinoderma darwinii]|uniref:folate receptor beta-like n=1 Tax=Rhinoderma darwinii TaxID=43563 RepID=UPI003F6672DE